MSAIPHVLGNQQHTIADALSTLLVWHEGHALASYWLETYKKQGALPINPYGQQHRLLCFLLEG
ncbi:MAG: hypothetical protein WCD86_05345 [Ktedonobacteraceae bacterium]